MFSLASFIGFFIPAAHAYTPTLPKWGQGAPGVNSMWNSISTTVYTSLPANAGQDIVHALTSGIVNLIFTFIAGAAVLLIMYAGIRMVISRGKEDEFTQGKTIIIWAVLGLVLALLGNAVITFFAEGFLPTFLE